MLLTEVVRNMVLHVLSYSIQVMTGTFRGFTLLAEWGFHGTNSPAVWNLVFSSKNNALRQFQINTLVYKLSYITFTCINVYPCLPWAIGVVTNDCMCKNSKATQTHVQITFWRLASFLRHIPYVLFITSVQASYCYLYISYSLLYNIILWSKFVLSNPDSNVYAAHWIQPVVIPLNHCLLSISRDSTTNFIYKQ